MDQVTQQNAAMVEESTAAIHALAEEAEALARLVARYQIRAGSSDDPLRAELKKAAPHAFRDAVEDGSPSERAGAGARQARSRLAAPAAKAVAGGSGSRRRSGGDDETGRSSDPRRAANRSAGSPRRRRSEINNDRRGHERNAKPLEPSKAAS